jgi:hypothetical protein
MDGKITSARPPEKARGTEETDLSLFPWLRLFLGTPDVVFPVPYQRSTYR